MVLFILNKQFIHFSHFLFEIFLTHFTHVLDEIWYIIKYMLQNVNADHKNKKLNRNLYNTVKSSLYYEILDYESKLLQVKRGPHTEIIFQ